MKMNGQKDLRGVRVTYLGDWVFYTGPTFVESPFEMMAKDCSLHFLGKPVTEALTAAGATVRAHSNWDLYHFSPEQWDELLRESDVLFVSDVEARCFHLNPSFFERSNYGAGVGARPMTFPDRLKLLTAAVEAGKGLVYLGGWLSFSGHMEKGGWRRCPISAWLPFECLVGEDLVESSEGFGVEVVDPAHPVVAGLPVETLPPLLGYNEFRARPGMEVLWRVAGSGHPLLGVSRHGRGRMVTYGSDPVPHWGINLMRWEGYAALWQNMAAWAAGEAAGNAAGGAAGGE
jgi:uncharacterized membrane protein